MYGIGGILDTLTIGFGIYDVIIGTKNLQGSGTITDNLKEQANLVDLSLLGILNIYQDLVYSSTAAALDYVVFPWKLVDPETQISGVGQ